MLNRKNVVESAGFFAGEIWLEQNINAMEKFSVDRDDFSVWELEGLLLVNFPRSISALCRNPNQSSSASP